MHFEEMTKENLYIALEIINSNKEYSVLENGNEVRTFDEIEKDFLNPETISSFIKLEDTYIGVIDYLLENPKDHYPWLGLFMIHHDYKGYGFGTQAYLLFESEMIINRGLNTIRMGVLKDNTRAQAFWESLGYHSYKEVVSQNGRRILCYEKHLI